MYFKLVKYFLFATKFLLWSSLAYIFFFHIVSSVEGSIYTYSIMASGWTASMYIAQHKYSHAAFTGLPVSRNMLFLADYTAYLINLFAVNSLMVAFVLIQNHFVPNEFAFKNLEELPYLLLATGASAVLAKVGFDYFRHFGMWGNIVNVLIAVGSFVGLTTFTLGFLKNENLIVEWIIALPGIILLLILFFVTKHYIKRLDF